MNTKFLQHLPQHSTGYSIERFLKSTKQQYSLPAFPFCLDCFCLSISDLRMNILSVVRKSFLKPACPLALTACSSAQDAILCSSIFANSLATSGTAAQDHLHL
ncbi:TPA: hypothetical protein ACH3X1_015895 [Trebouxia sp. C0004]